MGGQSQDQNIIKAAFERHAAVLAGTLAGPGGVVPEIERAGAILIDCVKNNRKLLLCGNGGSAADAQHFAAEFTCRYKEDRRPLRAVALTTDTSALTAIGNDYGYEEVFRRQVEALGDAGDVLAAFTTSGTSKNILSAIREAKSRGLSVIVFTGEGGVALKTGANGITADVVIIIPSSETARVQEMHELIYHALCEKVDAALIDAMSKKDTVI